MYQYEHGGNGAFEQPGINLLDFSANINPLGIPKGVGEAIREAIPSAVSYPDSLSRSLRQAIGEYEGLDREQVFCGNGASDIIFRIVSALSPRTALITAPTFSDYKRALRAHGSQVFLHSLREENGFSLTEDIIDHISQTKAELVFICNPNNPTGVVAGRDLLENLIIRCHEQGTYVAMDECFLDFVEDGGSITVKPLLAQYPNLILLKAFTKIFALPGIRLGYALSANSELISRLYAHGPDWPVSCLAQVAGIAALKKTEDYLADTLAYITAERVYLKEELTHLGYTVFDCRANYLFFKNPYEFDLWEVLNQRQIRIRSCRNFDGLSRDHYRIGILQKPLNRRLMEAIRHETAHAHH